jgi:hypothetical protein
MPKPKPFKHAWERRRNRCELLVMAAFDGDVKAARLALALAFGSRDGTPPATVEKDAVSYAKKLERRRHMM